MKRVTISFIQSSFVFIFSFTGIASLYGITYDDYRKFADSFVESRAKEALHDPTRPTYHLTAPSGWINDPCGLFYYNSSFHVFCQSNPWGDEWGNMSWSHIVSDPDRKWDYKWFYPRSKDGKLTTTAILPSQNLNSPDKDGIFTGCVRILPFKEKDKTGKITTTYFPAAFYSAVWGSGEKLQETICMARAVDAGETDEKGNLLDPYLINWEKYSVSDSDKNSNPDIIISQPESLNLISFRDPYVFNLPDNPNYYMLISGGIIGQNNLPKGVILLYSNDGKDLTKNWNLSKDFFFSGPVAIKDKVTCGGDFECSTVYRLTDHIGTVNETPYILIFGQDGSATDYGKSIYYLLGHILKTNDSIQFSPLDNFQDKNGNPIYRHLDINPDFVFYATQPIHVDNEQRNYLYGWLNIGSQSPDKNKYPWCGMLSTPRFLFAFKDSEGNWALGQEPALVGALKRKMLSSISCKFSDSDKAQNLEGISNLHLAIQTTFSSKNISESTFGLKINNTDVCFNKGTLTVSEGKIISFALPGECDSLSLNILLDGSSMEIFFTASDKGKPIDYEVLSAPLPCNSNSGEEKISIYGSPDVAVEVQAYEMDSCWTNYPNT
ncbi:MAG TPA: hypothetical protein DD381_01580 [Lentisphaeria bacterium]|nr:MAG: hypothetical protein A2X47_10450 [Lentisphaerae bacterium GWF2_38_69]HBM15032.1 hypothetical protein [Lentisphaeria bacterium]